MGLLFALAIAFSYLESLIPSVGIPGIKLGLSNTVTMYTLFFLGPVPALTLAVLKAGFAFLRGATAGLLSLAGGLCSVLVMMLGTKLKASVVLTSILGAVFHNIGQLAMAAFIIGSSLTFYYVPVLLVAGVVMGILTALVLRLMLPALDKLQLRS